MTNLEIIQLLKDLRWNSFTAPDGQVSECRGCSASYMPGHQALPKHSPGCRIARAIRALDPQMGDIARGRIGDRKRGKKGRKNQREKVKRIKGARRRG
jgi:hypothetical protein